MTAMFRKYKKKEIATRILETAIDLFFSSGDGFSIIHLAAASEEIVAGLLAGEAAAGGGISSARERAISALEAIHAVHGSTRTKKQIGSCLNFVRNQTKHHSPECDPTEIAVCLDLEVERALLQAIENHIQLFGTTTEKITRYINQFSTQIAPHN
jgi:hypothetical protein